MAVSPIVERALASLGQSQPERAARELASDFALVDDRSKLELFAQLREFARRVSYRGEGDWSSFFPPPDRDLSALFAGDGESPPHLALLLAALELYEEPKRLLNRFTTDHLDHYYTRVLRFAERPGQSDRAHLVFVLKPGASRVRIAPTHRLNAGKDANGVPRVYAPVAETDLNAARVVSLRSVFRDELGRIHCAPSASSSDGVGAPLLPEQPGWKAFGHAGLPLAPIGFGIASPLLRLAEGARTLGLALELGGVDEKAWDAHGPGNAFEALLTSPAGWAGPFRVSALLRAGPRLELTVDVPAAEAAIVDCDPKLHGSGWPGGAPVLQLRWRQETGSDRLLADAAQGSPPFPHRLLAAAVVYTVQLRVEAAGMRDSLALESESGKLDAKKPFLPFGPQPVSGSKFWVGCEEALSKPLTRLALTLTWHGLPADLTSHYKAYRALPATSARIVVGGGFETPVQTARALFAAGGGGGPHEIAIGHGVRAVLPSESPSRAAAALGVFQRAWATRAMQRLLAFRPHLQPALSTPTAPRAGFVTLELEGDFRHALYREILLSDPRRPELKEPYTPKLASLTLAYQAESPVVRLTQSPEGLNALTPDDVARAPLGFLHVGAFGAVREHGYERAQLDFVDSKRVALVAPQEAPGELLIGVSGVAGGDPLTLYVEAAAGSADPELSPAEVAWSVLCDNHWLPLRAGDVTRDSTAGLRRSGIVSWALPRRVTTEHSLLPSGLVWLRAAVNGDPRALPELLLIAANGVEVALASEGHDESHLRSALPARSIASLETPLPAVKALAQPYASFAARPRETRAELRIRASERLRHRDRCISAWDYERSVLEAFPRVRTVKCISHATESGAWLTPGHVLLIVVPDLAHRSGVNPLEPKLDADTLRAIEEHVRRRAPASAEIHVRNPRYQRVLVDLRVALRPGLAFSVYAAELNRELVKQLSPWASAADRPLGFGGTVHKSALIAHADQLEYVAAVSNVRLYGSDEALRLGIDANVVRPDRPDAILVSAPAHEIRGDAS